METMIAYDSTGDKGLQERVLRQMKLVFLLVVGVLVLSRVLTPFFRGWHSISFVDDLLIYSVLSALLLAPVLSIYFMVKGKIKHGCFGVVVGQKGVFIGTGLVSRFYTFPELDYVLVHQEAASLLVKKRFSERGPDITMYINDPDRFWSLNQGARGGGKYHFLVRYAGIVSDIDAFIKALCHHKVTVYRIQAGTSQIETVK